jgi:hypothetical protein
MSEAWELMQEAERLQKRWRAAEKEYEQARDEGRPTAEIDALRVESERLRAQYFEKAKKAVALARRK